MKFFKRFQAGDKVTYIGHKFAQKLSGSLGVVDSHVQGTEGGIVVTFGSESYILDENVHLTRFQGKMREALPEVEVEQPKDVEVTKRRGGKRRSQEEME